jgi:DNA repair protein RecN (Recombination protein N)
VARQAQRYAERIEADPERLEQVNERIYELEGLMRQHGPTLDDVIAAHVHIEGELAALEGAQSRIPELDARMRDLLDRATMLARRLSKQRRGAARKLGAAISGELDELGMGKARVVVEVLDGSKLGRDGIDRVQFLIAPNRGMEPRPLARIASGGELSRALLALKRALLNAHDEVGIQVFDEVDSGVGGATADKIGRAIASIASSRQVLCITHLAAIAAHASAHFVVEKHDDEAATATVIRRVTQRARVAELARMLTGSAASPASLRAAAELLAAVSRAAAA